jgi:ribosomal protein S18 acetylase RimI-like enzyme
MNRVENLTVLSAGAETLFRTVLAETSPDIEDELGEAREGLADGSVVGAVLRSEMGDVQGLALWRWDDEARHFAGVHVLALTADAAGESVDALLDHVWQSLLADPALHMIGVRVRGESPIVRDALARRNTVTFGRWMMVCDLFSWESRDLTPPPGYRLVQWEESHQRQAEVVAVLSLVGSVDEVVVPDVQDGRIGETLRQIREGSYPSIGPWIEAASLVALDESGAVVGYIATVDMGTMGFVADIGVHPDHRRKGLGRLLVARSMAALQAQTYPMIGLAVTDRNPAVRLYKQLGFQVMQRGEAAIWWRDGRQLAWQ